MVRNRQIWLPGFMGIAIYLLCTTIAFTRYPLAYSPLANWLSDLGNPITNPTGAFSYDLGCVLTGVCLTVFFFGLKPWADGAKNRKTLLIIAQVTGVLSSLALIVSAIYPLGAQTLIHMISGKAHIFFVGFFLSFSATVILKNPFLSKWLAYFGFFAALVNFLYGAFLNSVFIAEWAAIGLFILYVFMISTTSLKQDPSRAALGAGQV